MSEEQDFDVLLVRLWHTTQRMMSVAVPQGWMPAKSKALDVIKVTPDLFRDCPDPDFWPSFRKRPYNERAIQLDARPLQKPYGEEYDPEALRDFIHAKTRKLWEGTMWSNLIAEHATTALAEQYEKTTRRSAAQPEEGV
jgi:hypothetical protein